MIGYSGFWDGDWLEKLHRIRQLRDELMKKIVALNPDCVSIENRGLSKRPTNRCRCQSSCRRSRFSAVRHPDPWKTIFHQKLQQQLRIGDPSSVSAPFGWFAPPGLLGPGG